MSSTTPILPAHIENTVRAIAKLHADHDGEAGPMQRAVERLTAGIGSPRFALVVSALILVWIAGNLMAPWFAKEAIDPPPFASLETVVSLLAFYVTVIILITQRRDDQIATYREQLTLELAILGEQKSAKIIALLEEIRQEHPHLTSRVDDTASEMAVATDPQALLNAIKGSPTSSVGGQ